ncbi:MAG: MarR family winged helix-turn-helix transcriptional regulator [Deltaproteobacteria bacterium]|nr:MarR family winged helix-turn-helix transcriptional regulator [Deltaproteobacteria bacterium]
MMESKIHLLHERFMRIVDLAGKLEKMPRRFGTGEALKSREIHLIEIIGDHNEALSVTDLSGLLGITKGAVSQNLKRMEKKGFTLKNSDPQNSSRSIVRLTSKGKTAYYAHRYWHENMDGGFKAYFTDLDAEKIDFLFDFIDKVEDFIKRAMQ